MLISLDFIVVQFNFFFNDTATTEIYTLSLHDALPISRRVDRARRHQLVDLRGGDSRVRGRRLRARRRRSEEHTSELQSRFDLVCRLLLEKKKKIYEKTIKKLCQQLNKKAQKEEDVNKI